MTEDHLIWNNTVDRLLGSDHAALNGHVFLGNRYEDGLPLLVPAARDNPHIWVMGGSGTGKTARVLAPYTAQRIACGSSVVIIDPKPDKAYFEACREECYHQEIPFRYVDITPGRWSYAFSPFAQSHTQAQTLSARAESTIQAFNLDYGAVYGGSYYTSQDELFCLAIFTLFPDAYSPADIARKFDNPAILRKHLGEKGWEDSNHIRAIFSKIAGATPLNVTPRSPGVSQAVLDAAIDMRQPFYTPQVIYFALDAKELRTTTRATIGLAFYNLLAAAKYVGPQPAVKVVCVIDEAQEVIGSNLSILLEQARSLGIELVLAHQNLSQLQKPNQDFRETFEENTGLHMVFNPVGRNTREWMEATSGEELHATLDWFQQVRGGFDPRSGAEFRPENVTAKGLFDFPGLHIGERLAPVWDRTTLMRLSALPGVMFARVTRDPGFSRDGGQWVPTNALFHVPPATFRARVSGPWPGPNGHTVLVEKTSMYDRRFEAPPLPTPMAEGIKNKLKRLREEP